MVGQFLTYLEYNKNCSKKTIITYKLSLECLRNYWVNIDNPEAIKLREILLFEQEYRKKGFTAKSTNVKISALRSYLKYCSEVQDLNTMNYYKIAILKAPDKEIWFFYDEERKAILNIVENGYWLTRELRLRNKLIVNILFRTWMRVDELCNLKAKDFREDFQFIGKGSKLRWGYVSPDILKLAKKYIEIRSYKSEYLIASSQWDHGKLTTQAIRFLLNQISKKVWFHINPHKFRHTFATLLLRVQDSDIYSVAKLLGHKSIETTQKYLWYNNQHLKKLVNSIEL